MNLINKTKNIYAQSDHIDLYCLVFVYLMVFFFPLCVTPKFFFTLNYAKFVFLIVCTSLLFLSFAFTIIKYKLKLNLFSIKTDYAMFIFCGVSILSALLSSYFPNTILGIDGRYNGMFTIIIYFTIYIILSRFSKTRTGICELLNISSCLVYLLGILNSLNIDPFSAYKNVALHQRRIFLSTIGNSNFFSTFIAITFPIIIIMFCMTKNKTRVSLYALGIVLGSMAFCAANSDSGFASIIVMMAIIPYFMSNKIYPLRKYFGMLLIFILSIKFYYILTLIFKISYKNYSTITNLLMNGGLSIFLIILLIFMNFLLYYKPTLIVLRKNVKKIKKIIMVILFSLVLTIAVLFLYFSIINRTAPLGGFSKYLRFSMEWGDFRGSVWFYLILAFFKFPFHKILIGSGPDTILQVMSEFYNSKMASGELRTYDSAHNEYIQYLVTTGLIGGIAYIALIVFLIYYGFKYYKRSFFILPFTMSVLSYCVQATFNISMISTTPLFIVILSLLAGDILELKKGEAKKPVPLNMLFKKLLIKILYKGENHESKIQKSTPQTKRGSISRP